MNTEGPMRSLFPRFLAFALAFISLPADVTSQQVTGQVLDPERTPISSAEIRFRTENGRVVLRTVSGSDGRFRAITIEAGRYWLLVDRLGYEAALVGPLALSEGDSIEVELFMAVDAIPLEPLTVTASRRPWWEHLEPPALWEFWERKQHFERLGSGNFYTYDDLKPLSGMPAALAIADLAPFFFPENKRGWGNSFFITGRSGCYPPIFLDGHQLTGSSKASGNSFAREPPLIDDWIHLSQIAGVEIYRGASDVPAEFRVLGSNCGAVAVWSLRGPPRR
jgi:hypothetical protein